MAVRHVVVDLAGEAGQRAVARAVKVDGLGELVKGQVHALGVRQGGASRRIVAEEGDAVGVHAGRAVVGRGLGQQLGCDLKHPVVEQVVLGRVACAGLEVQADGGVPDGRGLAEVAHAAGPDDEHVPLDRQAIGRIQRDAAGLPIGAGGEEVADGVVDAGLDGLVLHAAQARVFDVPAILGAVLLHAKVPLVGLGLDMDAAGQVIFAHVVVERAAVIDIDILAAAVLLHARDRRGDDLGGLDAGDRLFERARGVKEHDIALGCAVPGDAVAEGLEAAGIGIRAVDLLPIAVDDRRARVHAAHGVQAVAHIAHIGIGRPHRLGADDGQQAPVGADARHRAILVERQDLVIGVGRGEAHILDRVQGVLARAVKEDDDAVVVDGQVGRVGAGRQGGKLAAVRADQVAVALQVAHERAAARELAGLEIDRGDDRRAGQVHIAVAGVLALAGADAHPLIGREADRARILADARAGGLEKDRAAVIAEGRDAVLVFNGLGRGLPAGQDGALGVDERGLARVVIDGGNARFVKGLGGRIGAVDDDVAGAVHVAPALDAVDAGLGHGEERARRRGGQGRAEKGQGQRAGQDQHAGEFAEHRKDHLRGQDLFLSSV